MESPVLYLIMGGCAAAITAGCIPLLRRILPKFLLDVPGGLKKHTHATPLLGGCAIFLGVISSLVLLRFITNFPTGTLHSLRGILGAGTLIFILGLADDLRKPKGLPVSARLFVQATAAVLLIYYGVYIQIFSIPWLNYAVTFGWLVGLTNAFNLLDIMDGLCVSQAFWCATGLLLIALPGECWYVNFAAVALLSACLSFWPYNHCKNKIFLGDSGATFLGFMIAALSMGTQYSQQNPYGYVAALFIVAVPILDTTFVTLARLLQGKNPLKGSPDHLALRLKNKWPISNRLIVLLFCLAACASNLLAYFATQCTPIHTQALGILSLFGGGLLILWLLQKLNTSAH